LPQDAEVCECNLFSLLDCLGPGKLAAEPCTQISGFRHCVLSKLRPCLLFGYCKFRRAQERERAEHSGDEEVGPVVPFDLLACVRKRISCRQYF